MRAAYLVATVRFELSGRDIPGVSREYEPVEVLDVGIYSEPSPTVFLTKESALTSLQFTLFVEVRESYEDAEVAMRRRLPPSKSWLETNLRAMSVYIDNAGLDKIDSLVKVLFDKLSAMGQGS